MFSHDLPPLTDTQANHHRVIVRCFSRALEPFPKMPQAPGPLGCVIDDALYCAEVGWADVIDEQLSHFPVGRLYSM